MPIDSALSTIREVSSFREAGLNQAPNIQEVANRAYKEAKKHLPASSDVIDVQELSARKRAGLLSFDTVAAEHGYTPKRSFPTFRKKYTETQLAHARSYTKAVLKQELTDLLPRRSDSVSSNASWDANDNPWPM